MGNNLELGIATIGDLLLGSRIEKTKSGMPINYLSLAIPEYQRPYKWTPKNAYQLLDDIQEAMESNKEVYRVGTLILHHDEGQGAYNIVDGQQRTITFALLLHAFAEVDKETACKDDEKTCIPFLGQNLANSAVNRHNIVKNHDALKRRIRQIADKRVRNELRDYVTDRCELIVVITDDLSEAFQFFDSQNARGKALYPHDLLKAFHLREMSGIGETEVERIVKTWEDLDQLELSHLFSDYLYRLKEWVKGSRAPGLHEGNIGLFKGLTARDSFPYAQYYKGAFAYADETNRSYMPFVTGSQQLSCFQIDAPIIAGKPFFEYAKHYFDVLSDIQNNDKYEGYLINDNEIVKTLDLRKYKTGVGNRIVRLMFDSAILLYVDRFCPMKPSKEDIDYLDQFVVLAFIWAYSLRAQYRNVGWVVAQNYIVGEAKKAVLNSFNIYKVIAESDSPNALLSRLSDLIEPLRGVAAGKDDVDEVENGVPQNYLYHFREKEFWKES